MTATAHRPPLRICYVSGTRADFGLMASTLRQLTGDARFTLGVLATGMHLDARYGLTVREIEAAGLDLVARVPVDLSMDGGGAMAANIGHMLQGMVPALQAWAPHLVLLLGDRGEMLAGAIAGQHLNLWVAHIHGGERSGTVDEPVRHAISKLSHLHLVATAASRDRLVRMGEASDTVVVTGAPGLDGLVGLAQVGRHQLCAEAGLNADQPVALVLFHPVLSEADRACEQARAVAQAAADAGLQVVALMPNADAGGIGVRQAWSECEEPGRFVVFTHLERPRFVSWMAAADVMLGNSSSGIIEAASFGTPVVNVGSRQNLRERNANVYEAPPARDGLAEVLRRALTAGRFPPRNVYGSGDAGHRIREALGAVVAGQPPAPKSNAY